MASEGPDIGECRYCCLGVLDAVQMEVLEMGRSYCFVCYDGTLAY